MPGTRRFPVRRQHSTTITAALPFFRAALRARAKAARSGNEKDREAANEAERVVDRMMPGWRLWTISIWEFGSIFSRTKPPEDAKWHDDWARALAQLEALEAADREQRRQERAARRAAKVAPASERQPEPV